MCHVQQENSTSIDGKASCTPAFVCIVRNCAKIMDTSLTRPVRELVLLQYEASGQAWPETVLHSCPGTKKSHNAAGFKIYHSSGTSQFQFQGLYPEKLLKCAETDRMFIIEVNPLTGLVPSSDCTNTPVFSKSSCSQKRAIALENRDFKGCEIPAQLLWSFILGERTGTWH